MGLWGGVLAYAELSSASALRRHVSTGTRVDRSPVVDNFRLHGDGALAEDDPPISFERRERRQFNQAYINRQHFDFGGFGAGTLADMQLTSLLFMQVNSYSHIELRKILNALPAPPITKCVADHCCERTYTCLPRRCFRLFVNRVLYFILLLLLSRDVELNPGPLSASEIQLLQSLKSGQANIMSKLEAIKLRYTKHETDGGNQQKAWYYRISD